MSLEIERRFIVKGDHWKVLAKEYKTIKQGYLISTKEGWTVRVRIMNKKESLITLKYPHSEISRHEFEYLIPLNEAIEIMQMTNFQITKKRYLLNLSPGNWIIDYFEGSNFPLVLAEVELSSPQETIEKPSWCHKEVTGIAEFSNALLAEEPISNWPLDKRHLIL
tara:strand:+ start:1334 stop:1828 length:495 start_codon:yes stop_codon:yes gene_type:complete